MKVDDLFVLPLADFTAARNALASMLKKAGRADEAERVKAIANHACRRGPSINCSGSIATNSLS